ncbi:ABC transporter permease [uncultured Nostoc sp.]|uniref:ABC transporter permease n=1 Tax=uncultured Nostoc sp. TaxID=340711 RepID=UPI0035CBF62C
MKSLIYLGLTQKSPFKPSVPVGAIAMAVGVSGGIGLIFGVVPARRAGQLDPIVALRSA